LATATAAETKTTDSEIAELEKAMTRWGSNTGWHRPIMLNI